MNINEEKLNKALHEHLNAMRIINETIAETHKFEKDILIMTEDVKDLLKRLQEWKSNSPLYIIAHNDIKSGMANVRNILMEAVENGRK